MNTNQGPQRIDASLEKLLGKVLSCTGRVDNAVEDEQPLHKNLSKLP